MLMGFKIGSKESFILPLFFGLCIFFTAAFLGNSYALDSEYESPESETQSTTRMEALLNMDISDIMNIEVISATRSSKPLSQTPENITVVTAKDIELMNAHTVADVLNTVTGVFVENRGGPGSVTLIYVQGAPQESVALLMDGIPLNNLESNQFEVGNLPVQNIERIEIIKGPASSAWGSSLGGVINIITKSPGDGKMDGTLSASYGSESTYDLRAEAYGKKNDFGYYFYAGRLHSDGLIPDNVFSGNAFHAKLSYDITVDTRILFNIFYDRTSRGEGQSQELDFADRRDIHTLLSNLALKSSLNKELDLNLSLWSTRQSEAFNEKTLSTGLESFADIWRDMKYGADASVTWKHSIHNIVFGASYQDLISRSSDDYIGGRQATSRWAVYGNDTISLDKLSVTPGMRYEDTRSNGDFVSPSLGATYKLTPDILLRALVERGFYTPSFLDTFGDTYGFESNPNLKCERVMTYQFGAETDVLEYVWLKVSAFRHDITDAITYTEDLVTLYKQEVNAGHQRIQGIETEFRTKPVYNTSLYGGFTFTDTLDFTTGQGIPDTPETVYDIGLKYDDHKSFRALLKGRYSWITNASQYPYTDFQGKYDAFIFDLNLIKGIYLQEKYKAELFLTAHNIFNGAQYEYAYTRNPRRWVEAGIRYKF